MTYRASTTSLIAGLNVAGDPGYGIPASEVPSTGQDGPGYMYDQITSLGLTTESVMGRITVQPDLSSGESFISYEDSSFIIDMADGTKTFTYQLYVNGVATGDPQLVSITVGAESSTVTVTGVSLTGQVNDVIVITNMNVSLTGVGAVGGVGNTSISFGPIVDVVGQASFGSVGDVTVELGTPVTVTVTGLSGTASVGSIGAISEMYVLVSGLSATGGTSGSLVWSFVNDSQSPSWSPVNDSQGPSWTDVND